ncbi:MAG: hypothetical protein J0H14_11465 [Alphaproteobacteria bacterium]|nr:hypothetical protein [Alphaproteobacteria bacterium]
MAAAISALPQVAQAVIVDGGTLQTDGTNTTVDLYYFNLSQNGSFTPGLAELPVNPPPVSHPAIKLYRAGGPGAGMLVAAANATAAGHVTLNANLLAGDYIMVVSEYLLAAGNFGPLNPDAVNKVGYQYEFGISGGEDQYISSACDYTGNLNGTFTLKAGLPSCGATPLLPTYQPSVPEPDSFAVLAIGLLGLGTIFAASRLVPSRTG